MLRDCAGARTTQAAAASALAERALGQVATLVEDLAAARHHFARAVRHARAARDGQSEAEARLSRAFAYAQEGRFGLAASELDRAEAGLRGDDRDLGRVHNQRALVQWLRGDYGQAVTYFGHAAGRSRRAGDELGLMRIYSNRGVARGRLGRLRGGRARPRAVGGAGHQAGPAAAGRDHPAQPGVARGRAG